MAIPILLTAAALGVGWVALAKQRAGMGGITTVAGPEGQRTTSTDSVEGFPVRDPNQGLDPSTTPDSQTGGGGVTGDAYHRPDAPSDGGAATQPAPVYIHYGGPRATDAAPRYTSYQEARALAEEGPAQGLVW